MRQMGISIGGRSGAIGRRLLAAVILIALLPSIASARDALGVFGRWGAFRDPQTARCFSISEPTDPPKQDRQWRPFAAIGFWPRQNVRGQVNIRLSKELAPGGSATLIAGGTRFQLIAGGADAWAKDQRDDAAIVAAIRSGGTMSVHGRAKSGGTVSDHYELRGAATAIDAAALGCARLR
jgi:hypothetical protein